LIGFLIVIAGLFVISSWSQQQAVPASASNTNWGLSFQENGKPPAGNASADFLKQYNAYFIGATDRKVIYLTFDAGFENGYTSSILDTLKKHKVKATFFLVGNYLKTSPDLVKRMVSEGHIVGNHTYSHPDMSKISNLESFQKEMTEVEDMYLKITGTKMQKFYRPPQGKYSVNNLKQANELGYKTVFWSLAYVDWYQDKQPSRQQAFDKLLPRIHPGAIILLHSTSKTNAEILDELLTKWESAGYQFGTLSDLCGNNSN
jgi:peptidoglycan-N-acetylmuramic acid deacetylase